MKKLIRALAICIGLMLILSAAAGCGEGGVALLRARSESVSHELSADGSRSVVRVTVR